MTCGTHNKWNMLEQRMEQMEQMQQRNLINGKIFNMFLLFLILSYFLYSILLPLCGSVLLEIIASPNKSRVICGTEMRLYIRVLWI